MFNTLFLIVLPYLAVLLFIAGIIYRGRSGAFRAAHLRARLQETKTILKGWLPWQPALALWILLHLLPLIIPGAWSKLVHLQPVLIAVEALTMGAGIIALLGLAALVAGRFVPGFLPSVRSPRNLGLVLLVMLILVLGLYITANVRWAAQWAPGTIAPYLGSLLTFQPEVGYVSILPFVVRLHIALAFVLLILIPFTIETRNRT